MRLWTLNAQWTMDPEPIGTQNAETHFQHPIWETAVYRYARLLPSGPIFSLNSPNFQDILNLPAAHFPSARTIRTGARAARKTLSAMLPRTQRPIPERPWVAIRIKSISLASA